MRYFLLFICLLPFYLNAQSFIDFKYKNDTTICSCNDTPAKRVLDTLHAIKGEERFLACCYHCIGVDYFNNSNNSKAIRFYKEALKIREQYQDNLLWRSYLNMAFAYKDIGYYEKAIQMILKSFEADDASKQGYIYGYLGEYYIKLGEFGKAMEALESAIDLAEDDYELAEANNSLSAALTITRDSLNLLEALKHAEKAIQLFEGIEDTIGVAIAYLEKGNTHAELKQYEAAIQAYHQAKEIFLQENYTLYLAKTINNIATTLYAQNKHNEAIRELDRSLKIKKEYHENDTCQYTYAANYENLGENYEALDNTDKALKYYQLTLINLTDNFRNPDPNTNPTVTDNHYIYNKPDLIRILDLKAQAALQSGNIDLADRTYIVLDEWINEFYKDLSTNESKLTWIARAHDIYTHAIDAALKKDEKEKAFEYAEKARAVLLWQSHSQQAALSLLDDEQRENYDNLLAEIRQADFEYRDATDKRKDELKSQLDDVNQAFDQFEKTLSDSIPEYAQRKYQPKEITVKDVQNNILNDTTALIEYHWSADDVLYIFTLTKNSIHTNKVTINSSFNNLFQRFSEAINNSSSEPSDFIDSGYEIYRTIFAPAEKHLNKHIKKIAILPDGKLNYIPFDALSNKINHEWNSLPFLIHDYTFNYLYSCSSYESLSVSDTIRTSLYIAPEFGKKDDLPILEPTEIEQKLNELNLKPTSLTGAQPTYDRVIAEISNVDLIHLHAHAEQGANGSGKIHLYGGDELGQNDIQKIPLKARHVVLGACETGTGELSKGEGVLSLGWSFVYRGVPSVVMSLWKVSESSTSELMKKYYEYLDKGMSGDEALRQAKLELKSNEIDPRPHPSHWAAFIHTGNPPNKQFNQSTCKYFFILGGFLLISLLIYRLRKTKKSQK